jgi:restriction system protein
MTKTPWWFSLLCAVSVFIFLRFIVPAILWRTYSPGDAAGRTIATVLTPISVSLAPFAALFVCVLGGLAALKKLLDRRRLDSQTGLTSISALSWVEFEELVAEAYRRQGYAVERTGDAAGDGGVDVALRRDGQTTLVQCKQWRTRKVGVKVARELRGVMASQRAHSGVIVSCGTFTAEAIDFAQANRITLIGGSELAELVRAVQKERPATTAAPDTVPIMRAHAPQPGSPSCQPAPACPQCGSPMVQRTAKRGANAGSAFWGCPQFPTCRGVRPIAAAARNPNGGTVNER